jgi:hypothetical protein
VGRSLPGTVATGIVGARALAHRADAVSEGDHGLPLAAFGIDAVYTPARGDPVGVRVIARRPDAILGFGETRIHAETATFEARASEVASPRPGDQLTVGGETFVIQGAPERRDPDRPGGGSVWRAARRAYDYVISVERGPGFPAVLLSGWDE